MKAATELLFTVRLLSTSDTLTGRLLLATPKDKLSLFCYGSSVIYLEIEKVFPAPWLEKMMMTEVAGALLNASSAQQKITAIQPITGKADLRGAFATHARKELQNFFTGPLTQCRWRQEHFPFVPSIVTLWEMLGNATTFWDAVSLQDIAPGDVVFQQSSGYLQRSERIQVGAQEGYLLSRLEAPLHLAEIFSTVPVPEEEMKKTLLRLWAFGLLDSPQLEEKIPKPQTGQAAPKAAAPAAPKARERMSDEMRQAVDLVNQTYQNLSQRDFYSVLGVDGYAKLPEIKAAYYKLAKRFHPDRFYGLDDPSLKEKVDIIFSAINVAYETLKNSKSRQEYDFSPAEKRAVITTSIVPGKTAAEADPLKVAEDYYKQAQRGLETNNFYQAVQFLRSATQIAPGVGKYWRHLGVSLSRNPQWRKEAEDSFQRAMELEPKNAENHVHLGFLYKNSGMKLRARKHFATALELDPVNELATRELDEIDGGDDKPQKGQDKKGLLGGLFNKKK